MNAQEEYELKKQLLLERHDRGALLMQLAALQLKALEADHLAAQEKAGVMNHAPTKDPQMASDVGAQFIAPSEDHAPTSDAVNAENDLNGLNGGAQRPD